jgi:hypothetical protein
MKFTETRKVWISGHTNPESLGPDNSYSLILSGGDMTGCGWSQVGTAEVEIDLCSPKEMTANKLEALKAELNSEMAGTEIRQSTLRNNISKLLAITHEVTA